MKQLFLAILPLVNAWKLGLPEGNVSLAVQSHESTFADKQQAVAQLYGHETVANWAEAEEKKIEAKKAAEEAKKLAAEAAASQDKQQAVQQHFGNNVADAYGHADGQAEEKGTAARKAAEEAKQLAAKAAASQTPVEHVSAKQAIEALERATIDQALDHFEVAQGTDGPDWTSLDFKSANVTQVERAAKLLQTWAKTQSLQSAELSGREAMQRKFDVQATIVKDLEKLPLSLLSASDRRELMRAPEMSAHAAVLFALEAEESAEEKVRQLSQRLGHGQLNVSS